ncbi:hypothetical protein CSKR_112703 [Clonorchis sinensis]|uniref:Uncharacterized protein n=1 Tax=Clonorchis sinensis TaxID=79923 RepID=A0A8T1N2S9_CLOSI|nr:hypothetical protein CSKR_112703 [Clonorchis sinensis]
MTQIETELLHTLERQQTSFNLFMNQFLELASLTVLESGPAGEKMNDTGMVFKNLDQLQREVYAILNRLLSVILDLANEAKDGVDVNRVRKVLIDLMNRYQADFYRTMTGFLSILTNHLSTEQMFQASILRMLETISFISRAENVNTEQVTDTESVVKIIMKKCLSMINETVKKVEDLVQRFAPYYPGLQELSKHIHQLEGQLRASSSAVALKHKDIAGSLTEQVELWHGGKFSLSFIILNLWSAVESSMEIKQLLNEAIDD